MLYFMISLCWRCIPTGVFWKHSDASVSRPLTSLSTLCISKPLHFHLIYIYTFLRRWDVNKEWFYIQIIYACIILILFWWPTARSSSSCIRSMHTVTNINAMYAFVVVVSIIYMYHTDKWELCICVSVSKRIILRTQKLLSQSNHT